MRTALIITGFICLAAVKTATADELIFYPNRVVTVTFTTTRAGARIACTTYDKVQDKSVTGFKATLKKKADNTYVSEKGTTFALKHLEQKIETNPDGGTTYNTGEWQLTITGKGPEYDKLTEFSSNDYTDSDPAIVLVGDKKVH